MLIHLFFKKKLKYFCFDKKKIQQRDSQVKLARVDSVTQSI
jgi:hypothetical protein